MEGDPVYTDVPQEEVAAAAQVFVQQQQKEPEPGPEEEPAPRNRPNLDRGLMAQIFERKTKVGPGALRDGEIIERKRYSFILDGSVCTPGFFQDEDGVFLDVRIGLHSLTSAEEINALKGMRDPGQAPFMLARACLATLNDEKLTADQRDFLWEGLGMGGRQLCLMAFQSFGSASYAALGKFQSTLTIG